MTKFREEVRDFIKEQRQEAKAFKFMVLLLQEENNKLRADRDRMLDRLMSQDFRSFKEEARYDQINEEATTAMPNQGPVDGFGMDAVGEIMSDE